MDACGIPYEAECRIDAEGCRRSPFDIAVLKDGQAKLFIECDGAEHYEIGFFLEACVREERCLARVVKTAIGEAKRNAIAARFGIPVLRIRQGRDIVCFRLDKRSGHHPSLFGDENASGIVLIRKFEDCRSGWTNGVV